MAENRGSELSSLIEGMSKVESELREFRAVLMKLQLAMIEAMREYDKRLGQVVNSMALLKRKR